MKIAAFLLSAALLFAQPKPAISPADFGKWESLGQATLSPDGKWLAHDIARSNGTYELRVSETATGKAKVAAFGKEAAFSSDSRWVAYAVGVSDAEEEKLKKAKKPVQNKLGIMDLTTGATVSVDDVSAFAFSDEGAWIAFRRYPPVRPTGAAAAPPDPQADPAGATLTVRNLATGLDATFGNVTSFAWQEKGTRLAMTVGVDGRAGNALQAFDPARGELKTLDSGPALFTGARVAQGIGRSGRAAVEEGSGL